MVLGAREEGYRERLNVDQGDHRGFLLVVTLEILLWAIVKVLELLFHHELLEVTDGFQGRTTGEMRHVGIQLRLVDLPWIIVSK